MKPHRSALPRSGKLALPHDAPAANDGADGPALQLLAVIWRPAATRGDPPVFDCTTPLHLDNCEIGVIAGRDPPLARYPKKPRGPRARHVNEAHEAKAPLVHMIEHDRDKGLHAGHAGRALGIGPY